MLFAAISNKVPSSKMNLVSNNYELFRAEGYRRRCIAEALSILMSFVRKKDEQLPWWGMLLAFFLAWIVTLPAGVIQAITNQQPGYDMIARFIIGNAVPHGMNIPSHSGPSFSLFFTCLCPSTGLERF
ncbi:oligopeptide transporter 2 isoform X5 [Daucus carota subsp. sativus]|uniref:oligopeptide transporter 2 isoform X5 n=2 Tax=Daucus carota subsp. sativus TaxID=79200 RepID=UPI003082E533